MQRREDELEAEIDRLTRRVDEELGLRDELLAIASHELRTPLQVVSLHLDALRRLASARDTVPSVEVATRIAKIEVQLGRTLALVERILDSSALDAGAPPLSSVEPIDLAALATELVDEHGDAFARAGCAVTLSAPRPVVVEGDRARLQQAIGNLVGNAMKYGAGAPIDIAVAERATTRRALLSVRDHGMGIAAADQPRVFDKYIRAASAMAQPGLGLGLWITRRIVEAHGGLVVLVSSVGHGANFSIELPLSAS
jgi:signal transduction histidine kinase